MYYLVDTNIFLHVIDSDIYGVAVLCKDNGECELLAIAKASAGIHLIVSNDKGKVYQHPDQNLFDAYANDPDVTMISGEEWLKEIGYAKND